MKKQILVVGDDQTFFQTFQNRVQRESMEVSCVLSVAEALESVLRYEYCLVILSFQISESSDMELLRMIRKAQKMPIIMLVERLTTANKVGLFQAGANALIEKPIDFAVCVAQATSLIQLYLEAKEGNQAYLPLIFGTELIIDTTYRQVIIDGEPVALTCKEFELLVCLAKHPCQVWSRAQLYHYVWNDDLGINGDNTVKTHIGNLKKKLADFGKDYIQNSRGVGYKFVPPVCSS
ncbi:MAG: response regulator transcription factor [Lachnospiraceae bacterium]|nr:response regulator transcription factor [Lachnospiraceae bacterium]